MKNLFNRFVREEQGQDLIEYALLAGLISLASIAAITTLGGTFRASSRTSAPPSRPAFLVGSRRAAHVRPATSFDRQMFNRRAGAVAPVLIFRQQGSE